MHRAGGTGQVVQCVLWHRAGGTVCMLAGWHRAGRRYWAGGTEQAVQCVDLHRELGKQPVLAGGSKLDGRAQESALLVSFCPQRSVP